MNGTNGSGPPVRVLGIGGSTRRGSRSLAALRAALALAAEAGAETVLADVRALGLPLFDEDRDGTDDPASLGWLLAQARAADALVFCSPTYLGTVAGGVKNALDCLSLLAADDPPYLGGKPVGVMAVGGANAANAIEALGQAARSLRGLTVPTAVAVPERALDTAGALADEAVRRRLGRMVGEVIDLGRRLRPDAAGTVLSAPARREERSRRVDDELLASVEREILAWPGVRKEHRWTAVTDSDVAIYWLGRRQIGHVHDDGVADFQFPKPLHDELIAAGRAEPHRGGFPAVVSTSLRTPDDVPGMVALFRLGYERAHTAAAARGSH
ncbi:MAG: NAD(P)H-dependent oxidoreductase [Chloroflexota bacterium]|nr:NAD(P)H-dependent oxidoreductase [Chloroflexota bacterium]